MANSITTLSTTAPLQTGSITSTGNFTNGSNSLTTGNIVSSGSINNGGNTLTTGAITSTGPFYNGFQTMRTGIITASSITANSVYTQDYGSQGGNLTITSPFTLYLNTGNNCDTVFSSNRYFFQTQTGGNIECAINWGNSAQNGSYSMTVNGVVYAWGATLGSDDRIKGEEEFITGATETLLKLRPQTYNKYNDFSCSGDHIKESGLIAQEIWAIPELRHLVTVPQDATGDLSFTPSEDPTIDPPYLNWGSSPAGLSYTQLIPFLIKGFQEQQTIIEDLRSRIVVLEG